MSMSMKLFLTSYNNSLKCVKCSNDLENIKKEKTHFKDTSSLEMWKERKVRKGGERPIDSTTIAQGHTFFVGENLKTQSCL